MEEWEKLEDMVEAMEAKGRTEAIELWRAEFVLSNEGVKESNALWARLRYANQEEWLAPVAYNRISNG